MKKIAVSIFILLILTFSTNLMAFFYADAFGTYVNAGDAKTLSGAGGALSFQIDNWYNFAYKGYYSYNEDTRNLYGYEIELKYTHWTQLVGVELIPPIGFLERNRIKWRNAFLLGVSNTKITAKSDLDNSEVSDIGPAFMLSTGLQFDVTQHFSPFFDIAWHQSVYTSDMKNSDIYGYQFMVGFRYSYDNTQRIDDTY